MQTAALANLPSTAIVVVVDGPAAVGLDSFRLALQSPAAIPAATLGGSSGPTYRNRKERRASASIARRAARVRMGAGSR